MTTRGRLYLGGRWRTPYDAGSREVENPATEQVIARVAEGGPRDVDDAVAAARAAFPAWAGAPVADRVDVLERWYDELAGAHDELVATTVAEVGAPVAIAREAHVDLGLAVLRGYLDAAKDVAWEEQVGSSLVLREAAGVAACITPWNYPFYQVLAKLGGALVAGCTVVLKPAELTPLSAYLLVEAAERAGLPAGVLNLVPGAGAVVGEALVTHPDVDVVSFTGSTAVGARITALAAPAVKRVCLELGGKSASVVLDDADLVPAVTASVQAAMLNSGQTCSAWSRLLVPTSVLGEATEIAAAAAEALVLGDPLDEDTWLGPVVSAAQRATVAGFVDRAVAAGARVVTGGSGRPRAVGHFHAATVLTDVAPDAEVVRDEVFGPVLTIQGHDTDADAVALANATPYGLHGAVWSADPARALAIARRMRTGQVDLNGAAFNPAAPFGGYGRSGNGRELGRFGIEEFLETKSVQR
ncbi:aldehyde dehydrogenase family protein [Pimelobacter simplex]|uniref:Aldehyde dehydrogenase n=1 Tax=Nocardioides simplex TaxID=2045 RepID=A0A0A1DLC7_NOCSI|nr:aldehyde dehydrogenase family protein [Pimelobacter simplex]AIY18139.1 Aldehyde dehydrogenase [Pimelobacter simplex]MCG8153764.1 aldehyde dehydrogenase family protein [Pimelobacter simplex]GEB15716.1 aldehyde dehydrogenase [Pimelobacter simplex]SFN09771.1 Acyl-CoA reductase [Pimelobacter simplex]